MLKIGLTGGIGSGKTTIANVIRHLGYKIYIADTEASLLINSDPQIRYELTALFGADIYTAEGGLNKKKLANLIFNDRSALQKVNAVVHPRVTANFMDWCEKQKGQLVFFESAILFEAELEKNFDYIVCVYASPSTRISRVMKRDHTTAEQVRARIANQMDDKEKCRKSDFTICTDENEMVLQQVIGIINKLTGIKK